MRRMSLIKLILALGVTAGALGVGASVATGAACTTNVLCNNENVALRDNAVTPPTGGEYGTGGLAANTAGALRFSALVGGVRVFDESPRGYSFIGIKLGKNPLTSKTVCEKATAGVDFSDFQNGKTAGVSSPIFDNNLIWALSINSDNEGCAAGARGLVTIEKVGLYFPGLTGALITGTVTGHWVQPGECSGGSGGVKLEVKQAGLTVTGGSSPEIDNGTAGNSALICFVSANNYVYPQTAPLWTPLTGNIWKD